MNFHSFNMTFRYVFIGKTKISELTHKDESFIEISFLEDLIQI